MAFYWIADDDARAIEMWRLGGDSPTSGAYRDGGPRNGPQTPQTFGAPRRSRGAPLMPRGFFLLGLGFLHDLVGLEGRHFLVVGELHRVTAAAAGHRAQARLVRQHLRHRRRGTHGGRLAGRLHAVDAA